MTTVHDPVVAPPADRPPRWPARTRLALAGTLLLAAATIVLARLTAAGTGPGTQPHGLFVRRWSLLGEIGIWWAMFAAGAGCLLAVPRRAAVWVVIAVAVGLRVAALAPVAPLSDDLYRYAWDGTVQAAGIDPYSHAPDSPALDRLHDGWLWPDAAGCADIHRRAGCSRLNREQVRTIYPPAAQAFFLAEHVVVPASAHDRGYELVGFALDLGVIALLLRLLRSYGRDPRWAVLYAWSPVAVLEAVQNAHVDSLAALLALLAVDLARRRPALAAAVVGVATLVKLYPAVLLALVIRWRPVATVAAFTGVVVLGYLPHVIATGGAVLGYLPGFLKENNYGNGSGFLLLSLVGLRGAAAGLVALLLLAAAAVWVLRDVTSAPDVRARRLLGALLLVTTPGAAWYALPLVAVAALGGAWWWLAVPAASYITYFSQSLDGSGRFGAASGWLLAVVMMAVLLAIRGVWHARSGDGWSGFHRVARGGRAALDGP